MEREIRMESVIIKNDAACIKVQRICDEERNEINDELLKVV